MDEEMKVGVRLHKRLFGQNDVLDNELNYKVIKITKEQKRTFSQLDADMKCLKKQLLKTSLSSGEVRFNGVDKSDRMDDWDKPSTTVLKARMMLQATKAFKEKKNDEKRNEIQVKEMPKNLIRLEDLPRIRYEEKHREATAQLKTSTTESKNTKFDSVRNETLSDIFPKRLLERRNSVPAISTTSLDEVNHFRSPGSDQFESEDDNTERTFDMNQYVKHRTGTRRSSLPTDTQLLPLNVQLKMPSQNERRRSLPNISVNNGRKNGEVSMLCSNGKKHTDSKFLDYLDIKVNRTVAPSNAERRIQMKKSAAFQIYKYLANAIPNMSNQTIADIQRQRKKQEERPCNLR